MNTIEAMKAKHAKELANAQRELAIAETLPLVPDHVQLVRTGESAWLNYRKVSFDDALQMFRALNVVPYFIARDSSFTYDKPREILPDNAEEKSEPYAAKITVSCTGAPSAKLSFFILHTDGELYRVNIDLEGPGYIGSIPKLAQHMQEIRDGRNRVIDRKWSRPNAAGLADKITVNGYACTGAPDYYLHWFADCEDTATGADNQHAGGMLANFFNAIGE